VADRLFNTIYGHGLIGELPNVVHRPYYVVTMEDLWFLSEQVWDEHLAGVQFAESVEYEDLERIVEALPACNSVIGIGGGRAQDVAKYIAWRSRLPLFQVPTAMTVNAAFGHRSAVRFGGIVRYIGWAVPEAVYVDYDVIQSAPPLLNRSGVCDIFCYHTAHYDWRLAHERGKCEPRWPYDQQLVDEAAGVLRRVTGKLAEIHEGTDEGIRTLMEGHRWGGAAFHNAGWNPRHIEGAEHFLFYNLEYRTGKPFIHGQPVCLGIYIISALQDNHAKRILDAIERVGVPIRPEDMGLTWDDVAEALRTLREYVEQAGLWYTVVNDRPITEEFIDRVRERLSQPPKYDVT
jgi:glycerol-1-phosphate dehydrogenase [NAD(P)+]